MLFRALFIGILASGATATIGCKPQSGTGENAGHFKGKVVAEWLGEDDRSMKLVQDFAYTDPAGKRWDAPAGSLVDGASIPKAFWSLIGGPFEGKYRNASVVHDVGCQKKQESWQDVHLMFYHACRCGGVDETMSKVLYYAVYHGGPRWPSKAMEGRGFHAMMAPPQDFTEEQVRQIKKYIENDNPSVDQLRTFQQASTEMEL